VSSCPKSSRLKFIGGQHAATFLYEAVDVEQEIGTMSSMTPSGPRFVQLERQIEGRCQLEGREEGAQNENTYICP
jgi:hypothetical protein